MEFKLKTKVVLTKMFAVEAESPKDAMNEVQQLLYGGFDFNALEIDSIGFDLTDPTILEYNRQRCKQQLKAYKERQNHE